MRVERKVELSVGEGGVGHVWEGGLWEVSRSWYCCRGGGRVGGWWWRGGLVEEREELRVHLPLERE